jgi:hypothetical protein
MKYGRPVAGAALLVATVGGATAGGQTLAQLAEANGVDPQVVIDVVVEAGTARIDLQAARGEINAGQAALRKARLPERAAEYVNNPIDPDQRQFSRRIVMARAARTIGVPTTELVAALDQGQSIADVATANGVDPEVVRVELVEHSTERITAFVNGEAPEGGRTGTC